MSSNAIFVIHPYRYKGTWVFDDESRDLDKEPFVAGVPEIIDQVVGADTNGFTATFSANPFPGASLVLYKKEADMGGHWYELDDGSEGWLCPALQKYFPEAAPNRIHVAIGL